MKKLIIIDGNSLINRAFYALPPLTASDGTPSQAVYGFATILIKLISEQKPDYFAVAFDTKAPTFRHKEFDFYKATRKGMPDDLAVQLAPLKRMLALMNIRCIEREGFEADDIIGTVVKNCAVSSIIVTGDRDSLQLVDERVSVMLTKRGITDVLRLDISNFYEEIGLQPSQIVDYKAICGDASDNIPGVVGIGEKGAMSLLSKYQTLDNIYQNINDITGATNRKLVEGKESAYNSRRLATICTDMDLDCTLSSFCYDFPFSQAVKREFSFLGFRSLLKREELFVDDSQILGENDRIMCEEIVSQRILTKEELREVLSQPHDTLSFFVESNIYFSFYKEKEYELVVSADLLSEGLDFSACLQCFAKTLSDSSIKKVVFDAKSLKRLLKMQGFELNNFEDVKLMQYLVDMTVDSETAKSLIESHKGKDGGAASFLRIFTKLNDQLLSLGMSKLYREIELPLVDVLFEMEEQGIMIDMVKLEELGRHFSQKMQALTDRIYQLSGCEFNINSPKQMAEVLFTKLQIPYPFKTKSYSTAADVLQSIEGDYEIIDSILEYRSYFKLNNTYIDGIKKLTKSSNIIHTEFRQMITATGRLSSVEPNLQNIPIRDEKGKVLREVFISKAGQTLVSADYSQIELRLMAHYSMDQGLIDAYNHGEDIHASTAARVFGVPLAMVTSQMRREAKAVNFGIIYGISDFGLAKNLKISRYLAKKYIDTYFEKFSAVKEYLEKSVEFSKKNGYAETLLGRKRKIPELFSHNYNTRSFGERAAMNMPLQGSAADIIKIAMLKVAKALEGKKSKLILQVHDELIVDAADEELQDVFRILRESMMGAMNLVVPLEVNISCGKRWSECK